MPQTLRFLAVALICAATNLIAADTESVTLKVPSADSVTVTFPSAWRHEAGAPSGPVPPTLKLTAPDLMLQITFIPDPQGRFATKDDVDRTVTTANQQYVDGSVEKRQNLLQLASKNGHGCYAEFTDASLVGLKTLPPGQFRIVASGMLVINKQAAAFTLLANDAKSPEYRRALEVVASGIVAK